MHPTFVPRFTALLQEAVAYATTLLPDAYRCSANRSILSWSFTREKPSVLRRPYTPLPQPCASAHEEMAQAQAIQTMGQRLHAFLVETGALDVGLHTIDVDIVEATPNLLCLISVNDTYIAGGKRKGKTPAMIASKLSDFLHAIAQVPMDAQAPLHTYQVNVYHVSAPCVRSAVALYYALYEPEAFDDVLQGQHAPSATLEVHLVLNRRDPTFVPSLFADLHHQRNTPHA